jgi:Protein of unknown function (DUF5818)
MPKGSQYVVAGQLRRGKHGYELEVEGGGFWVLDIWRNPEKMLGATVRVRGLRSGFNLLDVSKIWYADDPEPLTILERMRNMVGRSVR